MKFEGHQVNIPVKGIMRAGTDNLAADGAMNEVVGMEFKDGSWLPYKEGETEMYVARPQLVQGVQTWVPVNFERTWLHKLSDGTIIHLFLDTNHNLYVEHEKVQNMYRVVKVTPDVIDVSFVGNALCVSTSEGLETYLRENGMYIKQEVTYPRLSLRVNAGFVNNNRRIEGVTDFERIDPYSEDEDKDASGTENKMRLSSMTAALGAVSKKGGLKGYVIACYAYRLKNGDTIMASNPILLSRPMAKHGDFEHGFKECAVNGNEAFSPAYNRSTESKPDDVIIYSQGPNDSSVTTYYTFEELKEVNSAYVIDDDYSWKRDGITEVVINNKKCVVNSIVRTYAYTAGAWRHCMEENGYYPYIPTAATTLITKWNNGESKLVKKFWCSFVSGNGLQYRVDEATYSEDSIIDSVCMFVSEEVLPYTIVEDPSDINDMFRGSVSSPTGREHYEDGRRYSAYTFPLRKRQESAIIEDLKKLRSLYLVKEIKLEDLTPSADWIDVELQDKLGDNLVVHEQLPLSALDLTKTLPTHLDAYNMRLHEYDYEQEMFKGHALDAMFHQGGDGQYDVESSYGLFDELRYKWQVKVTIIDAQGYTQVVNYDGTAAHSIVKTLSPILSYPDTNATSMTISIYELDQDTAANSRIYERTFPLKAWENLGLAVYVDPELKPIVTVADGYIKQRGGQPVVPTDMTPDTPVNNIRDYHNGMKASDVAYPSYFPAQFTYRIGQETILGLARLTIPVSQDNSGRNKLVVFCTDGIYTMDVDVSGTGAYTNQYFASPEVCVNRNSICEIGGAIFFATDKGLMVFSGENAVEMYLPELNGVPRFLPATAESKEARGIYKKMIDNPAILSKTAGDFASAISYGDFVDFIADENTHLIYISNKNKLLAYNKNKDYSYFIDIPSHCTTKLQLTAICDDGNNIGKVLWSQVGSGNTLHYVAHTFGYTSEEDNNIPCLIQTRPIKVQQDDKFSYRVVLTGYFEGLQGNWADLVVMGSLDGDHWRVIGVKEKPLVGGFHNLGCLTERGSWKYLMFIFAGKLSNNSHIDSIDITVDGRYNNKKR